MKLAADLSIRLVSSTPDTAEAAVVLDADFVGFAGHFPGAPVLPGMCHIDLALRAASLAFGAALDLVAVERARFVRKVTPGEELRICLVFKPSPDDVVSVAADHFVGDDRAAELLLAVTRRTVPSAPR
jgi:3-hydroxymyristoyl/3-hydroxydecanoyl-(acyl carrier protein) dehydratase